MTREEIKKAALEAGFDYAEDLDTNTLNPLQDIMDTCATNKCGAFGKNWGCPPHGTLEENEAKLKAYENGILVQVVGKAKDEYDFEYYAEAGAKFRESMSKLYEQLKPEMPGCIALGAGGCKICKECAKPEPCRFPEKRVDALEGYGIFITQLCKDNNINYYYGSGTIAYTGAILW